MVIFTHKTIKKLLFLITFFQIHSLAFAADIANGQSGRLAWHLSEDGVLDIEGSGTMLTYQAYSSQSTTPWFRYRDKITEVVVSEGIVNIGQAAFWGLNNLKKATLPSTITSIGGWGFYGCSVLETISIPRSVTSIGQACFAEDYCLNNVIIESKSLQLDWRCFWACKNLTTLTCKSEKIPSLASEVFGGGVPLSNGCLYVPKSLVGSYKSASQWKNWAKIVAIDSDEEGDDVSGMCGSLKWYLSESILYIKGNGTIPSYADNTAPWYSYRKRINKIVVSEGVTSIGRAAFMQMEYVTEVLLPSTLTRIGDWSFYNCFALESIDIPASVSMISSASFAENHQLKEVVIHSSNISLSWRCFWACNSLATFTCYAQSVPRLSTEVFGGGVPLSNGCLYVPKSLINSYKSESQWKDWAKIVAIEGNEDEDKDDVSESYNDFLESNWYSYSILETGYVWKLGIKVYITNKGDEDITLKKLVIVEPSNNSVLSSTTDESLLGVLKAGEQKIVYYTFATSVGWDTHWYEWYYEYKGHEYLFCSSPDDPMDVSPILSETGTTAIGIFDLNGKRISTLEKGINIIKYSDGTTKKVIVK